LSYEEKVKIFLSTPLNLIGGEGVAEIQLHAFLTSALVGGE
jgi:hypothetical protein